MNSAYALSNTQRVTTFNILIDMLLTVLHLHRFFFTQLFIAPNNSIFVGAYHAKEFLEVTTLSQYLTDVFSFLQKKFYKRYFEIVYDPNDLSQTMLEVTVTLKEKVMVKLPDLKIPHYVEDKYKFSSNYLLRNKFALY